MKLAHVISLEPTFKQANAFARAAGVARHAYNWALDEWGKQYKAGLKPNANNLKKQFNEIKGELYPWVFESPKDANQQAFADLGIAFKNFFESRSGKRQGPKIGYPTERKKGKNDSFYLSNDKFKFDQDGKHVLLPVIGLVRIREPFRLRGKILSGRIKKRGERWFLAVQVECEARKPTTPLREVLGVDLGLKTAVVTSSGQVFQAPKPLKASLEKLKRANRKLHRREKGGKNRNKARIRLAKTHARIANIRKDFWQKTTTTLCRENQAVVIEDFKPGFMTRNRKLARAASDIGLGMFRPMMGYKAEIFGCAVIVADKWFPSTQRCCSCGNFKSGDEKLRLGESEYICDACGVIEDRDLNAAKNLEQYPRLEGNCLDPNRVQGTPMDDLSSTLSSLVGRASQIAEVGTKQRTKDERSPLPTN